MNEEQTKQFTEEFQKHLHSFYLKGYTEGSQTFCAYILGFCKEGQTVEEIQDFCEKALGTKGGEDNS